MDNENKVEIAATRITLLLAEWIERSRESRSQQEKTVDQLVNDFGFGLIK